MQFQVITIATDSCKGKFKIPIYIPARILTFEMERGVMQRSPLSSYGDCSYRVSAAKDGAARVCRCDNKALFHFTCF